jgi:hypothetical protein
MPVWIRYLVSPSPSRQGTWSMLISPGPMPALRGVGCAPLATDHSQVLDRCASAQQRRRARQGIWRELLLFLDSDMVFPPTALLRLILHQKDIVGATYTKRVAPFDVLGSKLAEQPAVLSGDLLEMHRIPTGCLLINMQVFDKLAKPYFRFDTDDKGHIVGEDYVFCDRAREVGFRIWCDAVLSREIGHIGQSIHRLPPLAPHESVAPPVKLAGRHENKANFQQTLYVT